MIVSELYDRLFGDGIVIPLDKIAPILPKNPIVLEAGAHVGIDTIRLSQIFPRGTIHAIEPVPEIYSKLTKNTKELRNVRRYMLALSEATGSREMFISGGASSGSSSLLPPTGHLMRWPGVSFARKATVTTITLDDWAEMYHAEKVDFMWLDLQGMELKTLKMGTNILDTVKAIHAEVSVKELYDGDGLFYNLTRWLDTRGFALHTARINNGFGNALFVRESAA